MRVVIFPANTISFTPAAALFTAATFAAGAGISAAIKKLAQKLRPTPLPAIMPLERERLRRLR